MRVAWVSSLLCVVGCGASKSEAPATPPPPDDHHLHTTITPERGGSHIQIVGRAVALKELAPQDLTFLPAVGAVDVTVDLHVPERAGERDYRGATGEATIRCTSGCALSIDAFAAGSSSPGAPMPLPIPIDHFEARAVFANGTAELASWKVDAKDLRLDVTGHLMLARALADSETSVCIRLGKPSSPMTPSSRVAQIIASVGIAIDAHGMMSFKLGGHAGAPDIVDFGCDGQKRPPPDDTPPTVATASEGSDDLDAAIARGITMRSATELTVDVTLIGRIIANPMELASTARIVPALHDGKPHGYKLYGIRPDSLLAKLGLLNGDAVTAIDGKELTSAAQGLEIYTSLRDRKAGDRIAMTIERRGQPMTLTYTLR